jgi:hypothetical protein
MPFWKQVVVGNGSSALNFLQSALQSQSEKFKSDDILVIGKADLWARTRSGHAMGQTPALLERQLKGSARPVSVEEGPRITGLKKEEYLTAGDHTDHLGRVRQELTESLPNGIMFCGSSVRDGGITRTGMKLQVLCKHGLLADTDQVIVANGLGPPATLPPLEKGLKALSEVRGKPRGYPEIVDAVTYYNSNPPSGFDVLVYGGSATSSWACNHVWKAGEARSIIWMCRRGIDQISTEGNPVGRNSEVIQEAVKRKWILAGEIKEITIDPRAEWRQPRLNVELEIYQFDPIRYNREVKEGQVVLTKKKTGSTTKTMKFHQIVYAVGSNPMGEGGPGKILDSTLLSQMEPVYAKDYQFMTKSDDILIALKHRELNLWVVGAPVFGGLGVRGLKDIQSKYSKIGSYLPVAGTPPEGIAILSTAIDALTGLMQTDPAKFDWNRARPDEIANLFKVVYDLDEFHARMIAKSLVEQRSDSKFALKRSAIEQIVKDMNQVYRYGMDVAKLKLDQSIRT